MLADSKPILNRRKDYFNQLLNVHKYNDVEDIEIQAAEPLIPEPTLLEVEVTNYCGINTGSWEFITP